MNPPEQLNLIAIDQPAVAPRPRFEPASIDELERRANATEVTWIRFADGAHRRNFHAIYVGLSGGFYTYCERFIREISVLEYTDVHPHSRCMHCKTRLRLPYLVSDTLQRLKR
jgi:hypothetical protein